MRAVLEGLASAADRGTGESGAGQRGPPGSGCACESAVGARLESSRVTTEQTLLGFCGTWLSSWIFVEIVT